MRRRTALRLIAEVALGDSVRTKRSSMFHVDIIVISARV